MMSAAGGPAPHVYVDAALPRAVSEDMARTLPRSFAGLHLSFGNFSARRTGGGFGGPFFVLVDSFSQSGFFESGLAVLAQHAAVVDPRAQAESLKNHSSRALKDAGMLLKAAPFPRCARSDMVRGLLSEDLRPPLEAGRAR